MIERIAVTIFGSHSTRTHHTAMKLGEYCVVLRCDAAIALCNYTAESCIDIQLSVRLLFKTNFRLIGLDTHI